MNNIFFNHAFDKSKLKTLLIWCMVNMGQNRMINLAENLKTIGFRYATNAGISLGIDDLKTISTKYKLIKNTNTDIQDIDLFFESGKLNEVERSQYLIENWQKISEVLKRDINKQFVTINKLNPIYMMAFSGARGNISQVRQLIGMRGLMADPNGQIIHLPIKSNFREGLTVTEYLISCYGARKGVVDTALRTATAGYLTRRLVDTAQHVIISQLDCSTKRGIFLSTLYQGEETLLSLKDQIFGRVLGKNIYNYSSKKLVYRNQQIDSDLSKELSSHYKRIFVRSVLNCQASNLSVCQLCYGWNLAHSKLAGLGEVVGVLAAQSIGEPGTQLTMRTFHTGGVFSGSVAGQMYAPFNGIIKYSSTLKGNLISTYDNKIAFLVKEKGNIIIIPSNESQQNKKSLFQDKSRNKAKKFEAAPYTLLFVRNKEKVVFNQLIAQKSSRISSDQQTEVKYTVNSKIEGEIFFEDNLKSKKGEKKIWILNGKIYKTPFSLKFFPKLGDIIAQKFPVSQVKLLNTSSSFLRSLIVKEKTTELDTFYNHGYKFLLFSEHPIYTFSIFNYKNIGNSSLIYTKPIKDKEYEITIRFNKHNSKKSTIFIPYNRVALQNNSIKLLTKFQQKTIFIKNFLKNKESNYSEEFLVNNQGSNIEYFLPDFYMKFNGVSMYQSLLNTNKLINFQRNTTIETKQNYFHNNINKNLKHNFLIMYRQRFLPKESINFIANKKLNIIISTSDLFNNFNKQKITNTCGSNLLLQPKSCAKLFMTNYFMEFINFSQNKLTISPNSINKIYIRKQKKSDIVEESSKLNLIKQENLKELNYFYNILIFSKIINKENLRNHSIFVVKYFKYLLTIFKNYKNLKKVQTMKFLKDFYHSLKLFIVQPNYKIWYNNEILAKYLLGYNSQFVLINPIYNRFTLSCDYYLTNSINFKQISQSDLIENNLFNKNDKIRKESITSKVDKNNVIKNNYLLTFSILNGYIYTARAHKVSIELYRKCYFTNFYDNIYSESLILPKSFKEFYSINSKLRFWNPSLVKYIKKYFVFNKDYVSKKLLPNLIYKSRKQTEFMNLFSKTSFQKNRNEIDIYRLNLSKLLKFENIKLLTEVFHYRIITSIKSHQNLYDTNYKKRFINHNNTLSKFIVNQRIKEIFVKNSSYSSPSEIFSLNSNIFNKKFRTILTFSKLYKHLSLYFYIKFPILQPMSLLQNTYNIKLRVKFNSSLMKPVNLLNRITSTLYTNFQGNNFINNNSIKLTNFNFSGIENYFICSEVNKIINCNLEDLTSKTQIRFCNNHLNWLPRFSLVARITFLSPYKGEIINTKMLRYSKSETLYNQLMFLTNEDKINLTLLNPTNQKRILKRKKQNYFINKAYKISSFYNAGSLINSFSSISAGKKIPYSGRILTILNSSLVLRRGQPLLSPIHGVFYVWNGDFISLDSPIMTLLYKKLKTGDIVQGIPKIEHFFEARKTIKGVNDSLQANLYLKLLVLFTKFKQKLALERAVKRSFAKIQKIIIDGICRVYCSQGIIISRKHFEIIVKQMTSKVKVVDGGETGLLEGEFVNLYKIESINKIIHNKRVIYEPLVLGITKTSLQTDSFISSASFQETTKVLSQAALERKVDFLNGLKENVILGRLIPSGTGLVGKILDNFSKI